MANGPSANKPAIGKEYLINLLSVGVDDQVNLPTINKTTYNIKASAIKEKMNLCLDAVYVNYWDIVCKYLPSKNPDSFLYSILINKGNINGGSLLYKRLNDLRVMARELKRLNDRLVETIDYNEMHYG